MIVLLSLLALVVLGFIWWWVVNPHGESRHEPRDVQLPLYTTRTPGRGVNIAVPSIARSAATAAAMAGAAPLAPATAAASQGRDTAAGDGSNVSAQRPASGVTIERVFTTVPWVEPEAVRSSTQPVAPATANGTSNGRGASGELSAGAAPLPRPFAPPRKASPAAPAAPRSGDPTDADAARWGPRTERDPAETVQFLPGRLEVLQGRTMEGQEIRFVRPERAGDRAVVTFGRGEGAPYRHVQLKVPTVSRLHARMSLEPGSDQWTLENLSSTNPVAVNGADLAEGGAPLPLSDGDRVEMGEIVFVFRAR